ncbi:hypothetical protein [Bacillus thuringiensis]
MKYKDRKDAKRKYKQALLATVATMTLGVSTLGSTASAFAEEKKTEVQPQSSIQEKNVDSQVREIQGYLFKDDIKTPVYKKNAGTYYDRQQSDAAFPQLGSNPHDPIPKEGSAHSETGSIGSTLYFSKMTLHIGKQTPDSFDVYAEDENVYLEKNTDGSIEVGNYDPKTLIRTPKTETFDQSSLKNLFEGTTIKRDTSYQLKSSKVLPRTSSYKYTEGIKYGMTKEDAIGATLTIGAKMGGKAKAGIPGLGEAELSMEVSTQLAASYNHKISVTDEKTSSEEISFPGVNNTTYNYDEYAVALYQLQSTYTVKPSAALQKMIDNGEAVLARDAFKYADSTTYLAVTPGAAKK